MEQDETRTIAELHRGTIASDRPPAIGEADGLRSGDRVGRYTVLYRVGSGGMGVVYAAYDPDLDRKVALKLLHTDEGAEGRLLREARALAKLSHPNVVTVYDVGTHLGRVFVSMEFVAGETLAGWLRRGSGSWREVLHVFLEAGRGLAAAHRAGLVHGDFKPSNVVVSREGSARVLDFGLARSGPRDGATLGSTVAERAATLGEAGEVTELWGTPAYMAPERLRGEPGDARSDQYSFSVALWEALCGAAAEPDPETGERVWEPRGPSGSRGSAPGWVRAALLRGLENAPEARYSEIGLLLADLSREGRRGRRLAWGAAALLAAAATGLYLGSAQHRCDGAAARLAGVWDPSTKAAARQAFLASGFAHAEDAFTRAEAALDRYASTWIAEHTAACRATHVLGEQPQPLLDLRMLCLEEGLGRLGALSEVLRLPTPELVGRSPSLVTELPLLAHCSDPQRLVEVAPLLEDREARRRIAESRRRFDRLWARQRAGQAVERSEVRALAKEVATIGYRPWEARILIQLAALETTVFGDRVAGEETFRRAAQAAIAGRDPFAFAALVPLVGNQQLQFEEAERWAELAEAMLPELEGDASFRERVAHHLSVARGSLAFASGRLFEAETHHRRAVELTGEPKAPLGEGLEPLALAISVTRSEDPIAYFEQVLRIAELEHGSWSPTLGPLLIVYQAHLAESGRYAEALEAAERAVAILEPVGDPQVFEARVGVGVALLAQGRAAEAGSVLREAMLDAAAQLGERHYYTTGTRCILAGALIAAGRLDEAATELERAEASLGNRNPAARFNSLLFRGQLHLARGQPQRAATALDRAHRLYLDMQQSVRSRTYAETLTALGVARLGADDRAGAREVLEVVVAMGRPSSDDLLVGEAELALAQALWPDERRRALELGASAVAKLAEARSWHTLRVLQRAETWVAGHREADR